MSQNPLKPIRRNCVQVYRLPHLDHFCQETLLPYERKDKALRTIEIKGDTAMLSLIILSQLLEKFYQFYAVKLKKTVSAVRRSTLAQ